MKRLGVLVALLAGCHSPMHSPVYTGPGPVDYEAMVTIHRGLQDAAFHRRFILIERQDSPTQAAPGHERQDMGPKQP